MVLHYGVFKGEQAPADMLAVSLFYNKLTVIIGSCQILQEKAERSDGSIQNALADFQ